MLYSNHINIAASFIAILILIYIAVMTFTKKPIPIVPKATSLILVIWILSGIILYRLHPAKIDDFVSNFINSAVAIGTIGAVITSLYLTILQSKKEKITALQLDVNLLIKNLETYFINIIQSEANYKNYKNTHHEAITRITISSNTPSKLLEIENKYNKFQNEFNLSITQCILWLSIQDVNNDKINNELRKLIQELQQTRECSSNVNYIKSITQFIRAVKTISNNL